MPGTARIHGWSAATLTVLVGVALAVAYLYATVDFVRAQQESRARGLSGHPTKVVQARPARETM
jgi:hypothetical protein